MKYKKIKAFLSKLIPRKKTLCTVTFVYHTRSRFSQKYSITNSHVTYTAYVTSNATNVDCAKLFDIKATDMVYSIVSVTCKPIKTVTHGED